MISQQNSRTSLVRHYKQLSIDMRGSFLFSFFRILAGYDLSRARIRAPVLATEYCVPPPSQLRFPCFIVDRHSNDALLGSYTRKLYFLFVLNNSQLVPASLVTGGCPWPVTRFMTLFVLLLVQGAMVLEAYAFEWRWTKAVFSVSVKSKKLNVEGRPYYVP
jgi:hypothetical protein